VEQMIQLKLYNGLLRIATLCLHCQL